MGRIGTLITVEQDGNRDTLTLTENYTVQWLGRGYLVVHN